MINKKYSDDSVLKIFQDAPSEVRKILSSDELIDFLYNLSKENSLSRENMILVAESNRNLLLGLTSPAEVLGNLIFAGIPAENAQKILEDLNQKIFIPTHKKILAKKELSEHEHMSPAIPNTEKPTPYNPPPQTEIQPITQPEKTISSAPLLELPQIQVESHQSVPQQEQPMIEPKEVKKPVLHTPEKDYVVDPYRESF